VGEDFQSQIANGGYARGVAARVATRGKVLFGYFFAPCLRDKEPISYDDLHPNDAILRVRFGDLGLINGEWPICGTIHNWDRTKWGMPDFARRDVTVHP
jgi:hypothetical protein